MITPKAHSKTSSKSAPETALIQPNAENLYNVMRSDLPLSCPMPGMHLWNSHPKVYLAIEEDGRAKCPYCGATYVLTAAR